MEKNCPFEYARDLLLSRCAVVSTEEVPLGRSYGRIIAGDVAAATDIPPFDRSPYDGYAFLASDSAAATREHPVTLRILEEVAAGAVPTKKVVSGTAVKILTGAPLPEGADAVINYEATEFTAETVTLFSALPAGSNVVYAGEDVHRGMLLARRGDVIDAALAGTLAAQGISRPLVYKKPRAGIISTGDEIVEVDDEVRGGKIRNTNRYTLEAACARIGAEPVYLGSARDCAQDIAALMEKGFAQCDIVFVTGGASVGDYDLTPAALDLAGAEVLVRGIKIKPGGACVYAQKNGVLLFGLSGNPASAMTNFYAAAMPCLRRLCGYRNALTRTTRVALLEDFPKTSRAARLVRGMLELSDGAVRMRVPRAQGNGVLHTMIGCDVLAVIPPDSPPLPAGTVLDAYLLE